MKVICTDVENEKSINRCLNENQAYNQCCQECYDLSSCNKHCDYAHNWGCAVLEYIE